MKLQVDIQNASTEPVPPAEDIRGWIEAALCHCRQQAEVSVRLVDEVEMARLNEDYRGKNQPTNVLSFPADLPADIAHPLLGDIVVCAPVVAREARQQHKTVATHWAHMFVHGSLHLVGYDHIEAEDAQQMEALESSILLSLGCPCPYAESTPVASIRSAL